MPNTGRSKAPEREAEALSLETLLERALGLIERVERLLPEPTPEPDWSGARAFRWRKRQGRGYLQAIYRTASIRLSDLKSIDRQKRAIEQNTRQFMAGKPANNVLLTGARGTGKSSLIKACLNQFGNKGLRLVEVDKVDLVDLPDIVDILGPRRERFVVFCDDLSFEEGETGYKALKVALDGSVAETSENILIYATSNRRHLMPEHMRDNLSYQHQEDGEIHPGEVVEEKISLSERFGLWVSFYPFKQDEYLGIVATWLEHFGCDHAAIEAAHDEALRWALERGSRSGRVAWQFARDWSGRHSSGKR
jgi:predicted AAA+ superfamily ATPase